MGVLLSHPHSRSAAHTFLFTLPTAAAPGALSATYLGAGKGDLTGVSTPGVALRIWSFTASAWTSLGQNTALDSDAAAARTIAGPAPSPASDYVKDGRIWLLAAPLYPSSTPPGTVTSDLFTDYVELKVDYTLP